MNKFKEIDVYLNKIDLFEKYLLGEDEHLKHNYDLWKKRNMLKFTRRPSKRFDDEIEYDELSKYEKEEWKTLRNTNVKMIGKLFEELISNYENEYNSLEDDSKIKYKISNILDVLYFEYQTHLEHIMYPNKNK